MVELVVGGIAWAWVIACCVGVAGVAITVAAHYIGLVEEGVDRLRRSYLLARNRRS